MSLKFTQQEISQELPWSRPQRLQQLFELCEGIEGAGRPPIRGLKLDSKKMDGQY